MILTEIYMNKLTQNYQAVVNNIQQSVKAHPVSLVAVSKTFDCFAIEHLYHLGQQHFAESYVQEFVAKATKLSKLDIVWHFIGNIQSNKIKLISRYADWVHSLASVKHVLKLNREVGETRTLHQGKLNVLIEVNISNDKNKHGLTTLEEVLDLAKIIVNQEYLQFRGLMGMASYTDNPEITKQQFSRLHQFFQHIKQIGYSIDTLSMGMSNDYNLAIESGATMVRVGSKIFGERNYVK